MVKNEGGCREGLRKVSENQELLRRNELDLSRSGLRKEPVYKVAKESAREE